jgi:transposase-like protein
VARFVRGTTEALCGTRFSKSLVSELVEPFDAELEAWRNRPLTETTSPHLSMDARYEHVRQGGHREILAVAVADTESEATYHQVVRDLQARGLSGVRLVTSDDHLGLQAAIDRHFQGASWQRGQAHVARHLVKLVGAGRRAELAADLSELCAATTRTPAMTTVEGVVARWESSCPVVVRLFEEGSEDCLGCPSFP